MVGRRPVLFASLYGLAFLVSLAVAIVVGRFILGFHPTLVSVGAGITTVTALFGVPALVAIAVGELRRSPDTRAALGPLGRRPVLFAGLYCLVFVAALAFTILFDVAMLGYRPRMAAVGASVPLVGIAFAVPALAVISRELLASLGRPR